MPLILPWTGTSAKKAAMAIMKGHLVAFPTETVYGLGADASNKRAVERIYEVKNRPKDHPLIVHVSSAAQIDKWAVNIPDYAITLATDFWPGPMTLVLRKSSLAKDFVTGGQETIALRVPSHPVSRKLIKEFEMLGGSGIAAPSANKFGAVSPTEASHVVNDLSNSLNSDDLILDCGSSNIGLESTIINCTESYLSVLRPGSITLKNIQNSVNVPIREHSSEIKFSGNMSSHYAPKAKILYDSKVSPGDGFIAMGSVPTPKGAFRLLAPKTKTEFARNLYNSFRRADLLKIDRVIVVLPEGDGLSLAIRDRIIKAGGKLNA